MANTYVYSESGGALHTHATGYVDCDGSTDEDIAGTGASFRCDGPDSDLCKEGTMQCNGTDIVCSDTTGDSTESCNGLDDDCDGEFDEASAGVALTRTCSTDCGSGTETCSWGVWQNCSAPSPTTEQCNGLDDDCDGSTDEEITGTGSAYPCDGSDADLCKEGTMECNGTAVVCTDTTGDSTEVCNGFDDDCDS